MNIISSSKKLKDLPSVTDHFRPVLQSSGLSASYGWANSTRNGSSDLTLTADTGIGAISSSFSVRMATSVMVSGGAIIESPLTPFALRDFETRLLRLTGDGEGLIRPAIHISKLSPASSREQGMLLKKYVLDQVVEAELIISRSDKADHC